MDKYLELYWIESSEDGTEYHSVVNFQDKEDAFLNAKGLFEKKDHPNHVRVTMEQGEVIWKNGLRLG